MAHEHGKGLSLTEDSAERKSIPICTGVLDYFPAALAYVAQISQFGNDKHNPGEPLHHARGKSMDHADCILRHQIDRGLRDDQGIRHSGYVAWRALAQLQQELEDDGEAPLPRGARLSADPAPAKKGCPEDHTSDWCVNDRCVCGPPAEIAEPAASTLQELQRPEYTVKPVPRHQYDPESTDGGW